MRELEKYIPTANMIAQSFGKNCEVVLHDLSTPQMSVIHVVNSHVTGRKIGQSFDHLIKEVLLSKEFTNDFRANYSTVTQDGRMIKSSTAFIRNAENKVIGALCINFDISAFVNVYGVIGEFINIEKEVPLSDTVDIDKLETVSEIMDTIIEQIISNVTVDLLSKKEKIELIRFMEKKGVFLIKGSVDKVAERLKIAKVTVYSYLDQIKKEEM